MKGPSLKIGGEKHKKKKKTNIFKIVCPRVGDRLSGGW